MTHNPLHGDQSNIRQVVLALVLRYSDKNVLASYQTDKTVTVEGVRECIAGNSNIAVGKRYTSQGKDHAVHFISDVQGRVYSIVTVPKYSPRIAFTALDELASKFSESFGQRVASAHEGSLSRPAQPLLRTFIDKYANPANVDSLTAVKGKVDVVKSAMQENIQLLLANEEKMQHIEAATEHLASQADDFRGSAQALRNKMWWKMWKMRLLIGGLITAVLVIIIVPIAVQASAASKK